MRKYHENSMSPLNSKRCLWDRISVRIPWNRIRCGEKIHLNKIWFWRNCWNAKFEHSWHRNQSHWIYANSHRRNLSCTNSFLWINPIAYSHGKARIVIVSSINSMPTNRIIIYQLDFSVQKKKRKVVSKWVLQTINTISSLHRIIKNEWIFFSATICQTHNIMIGNRCNWSIRL